MVRVLVVVLAIGIYSGNADAKRKAVMVAVVVVPLVWVMWGDTRVRMWWPAS